eukprot:scaffold36753_cov41-Cyclotella_meneghiniana.AAC.2
MAMTDDRGRLTLEFITNHVTSRQQTSEARSKQQWPEWSRNVSSSGCLAVDANASRNYGFITC